MSDSATDIGFAVNAGLDVGFHGQNASDESKALYRTNPIANCIATTVEIELQALLTSRGLVEHAEIERYLRALKNTTYVLKRWRLEIDGVARMSATDRNAWLDNYAKERDEDEVNHAEGYSLERKWWAGDAAEVAERGKE